MTSRESASFYVFGAFLVGLAFPDGIMRFLNAAMTMTVRALLYPLIGNVEVPMVVGSVIVAFMGLLMIALGAIEPEEIENDQ